MAAERAGEAREHPATTTCVARQAALSVLGHVTEARRRATEGTDPETPFAIGQARAALGEIGLERGTERHAREKAQDLLGQPEAFLKGPGADPAPGRKQSLGTRLSRIPRLSKPPEGFLRFADRQQELQSRISEVLDIFRLDR